MTDNPVDPQDRDKPLEVRLDAGTIATGVDSLQAEPDVLGSTTDPTDAGGYLNEQLEQERIENRADVVQQGIGHFMSWLVLSNLKLPESIPTLEKVESVHQKSRKLAGIVKGLGSRLTGINVDDILRLLDKTNDLYHVHFDLIEEGRQAYAQDLADYEPEPKKKGLGERFRIRREEVLVVERLEDHIHDLYFVGFTSRIPKEDMLNYLDLTVEAIRAVRNRVVQHFVVTKLEAGLDDARVNNPQLISLTSIIANLVDVGLDYVNTHEDSMDTFQEHYRAVGSALIEGIYDKWGPKEDLKDRGDEHE